MYPMKPCGLLAKVSGGMIQTYNSGKATITAAYGGQTASVEVQVDLAVKLSINLKQAILPLNSTVQLVLTATHSDHQTEDVTQAADWTTSSDKIADVSAGLVTSYGNGTATITASYGGKTATVQVQVNVPTKIYLTKKELSLKSGDTQKLVVMAVFADNSERDVTSDADWSTSSYSIADIAKGTLTANSAGTTTITAKFSGKQTSLKVIVDQLKYFKLSDKKIKLAVGATKQVHATATFTDNTDRDVSISGIWSSSNAMIADVKDGVITAYGTGTATITCKFAGKTVSMQVVVN
jgi:hypothetical protein